MSQPTWSDLHTADEWADVLDEIAMRLANRHGDYGTNSQLRHAASCLREMSERLSMAASTAEELQQTVAAVQMKVRAAMESFSKLP